MRVIRVPSLAENITEVTVGRWLVAAGEAVTVGMPLVELLTEKAEFALEAEVSGVVTAPLAPEKSVMPVGSILLILDASEAEYAAAREENERCLANHLAPASDIPRGIPSAPVVPVAPAGAVRATPVARRIAKERGLDLAAIAAELGIKGVLKEEHMQAYLSRQGR